VGEFQVRKSLKYAICEAIRAPRVLPILFLFAYLTWSEATLAKLSMTLKRKVKKVAV
jgi:hypothetical protein